MGVVLNGINRRTGGYSAHDRYCDGALRIIIFRRRRLLNAAERALDDAWLESLAATGGREPGRYRFWQT